MKTFLNRLKNFYASGVFDLEYGEKKREVDLRKRHLVKKLNINHYNVEQENANEPFQARSFKPGIWTPYNGLREVVPFSPGGGGDSAYERGGDARRKFWIKPLKETNLGVAQAFFDP